MNLDTITKPTLILNEDQCRDNISRMAQKAGRHNLKLKPHVKTHQSIHIGEWLKEEGIDEITVSSVDMAEYFAAGGWKHITIAFPANIRELNRIDDLASRVGLSMLIQSEDVARQLAQNISHKIGLYVEIDTGSHRTGFKYSQTRAIEQLVEQVRSAPQTTFKGFYSHPGHSYHCSSRQDILEVHQSVCKQMQLVRDHFSSLPDSFSVCIGDTPCCSAADSFEGIDEISPGNFVFYDLMQSQIGSCNTEEIAVALGCPVVAKFSGRNEIVVHGGAVHLSKDSIKTNDKTHFGRPVILHEKGWDAPVAGSYVTALSQEHGIISCSDSFFDSIETGDLIGILPVHSCLTADCMGAYTTLDGQYIKQMNAN